MQDSMEDIDTNAVQHCMVDGPYRIKTSMTLWSSPLSLRDADLEGKVNSVHQDKIPPNRLPQLLPASLQSV